jgi:hypothetical protein
VQQGAQGHRCQVNPRLGKATQAVGTSSRAVAPRQHNTLEALGGQMQEFQVLIALVGLTLIIMLVTSGMGVELAELVGLI